MKKLVFILALVFIFSFFLVSSLDPDKRVLEEGKNYISFEGEDFFYASSLVILNPSIESITYVDDEGSHGYVNFMGGIGENFLMDSSQNYEIISKENVELKLP